MPDLENQLHTLEFLIPEYKSINSSVSIASAGWHIEHSLLTIRNVLQVLLDSDPIKFEKSFSLPRTFILATGIILRGRAAASRSVVPEGVQDVNALRESLYKTRKTLAIGLHAGDKQYFRHPMLGCMSKKQTMRFLEIHTNHHLKIIREIVRK